VIDELTQVGTVHHVKDTFDAVLPVLTLILGAWLARWTKKSDVRSAMRIESADLLADLPSKLWAKGGDDDWVNLNAALSRLSIRLAMTGLPSAMATALADSAITFWRAVEEAHTPEGVMMIINSPDDAAWLRMSALVSDWLSTNSAIHRRSLERGYNKELLQRPSDSA
jgi:hypothetical protein